MNTYKIYKCTRSGIEYELLYILNDDENKIIENSNSIFANYFMLKNIIYAFVKNYLGTFYNFTQYITCFENNLLRSSSIDSFKQKYKNFEKNLI